MIKKEDNFINELNLKSIEKYAILRNSINFTLVDFNKNIVQSNVLHACLYHQHQQYSLHDKQVFGILVILYQKHLI